MSSTETMTEATRASGLREAEEKAVDLFKEVESKLIRSGISDKQLSDEIHALGAERHNVRTHWHKRIVRSGPNTLKPFEDNPPDRIIEPDDILVVDLGPVFQQWEADFGRTFNLGSDSRKQKLVDALEPMWHHVKGLYLKDPDMTGEQLYDIAREEAEKAGWVWGAWLAGHVVGDFPHERIPKDKIQLYITPGNKTSLTAPGKDGFRRHWILEIHLRDPSGEYGGFFEQILTVD